MSTRTTATFSRTVYVCRRCRDGRYLTKLNDDSSPNIREPGEWTTNPLLALQVHGERPDTPIDPRGEMVAMQVTGTLEVEDHE